jgi:hypothetical protein
MGILKHTLTVSLESFMRGYRLNEEEAGLHRARAELRKQVGETITIGRAKYKLNRLETIASYSRDIPGRARRVIRGCRTVVSDILKRKR